MQNAQSIGAGTGLGRGRVGVEPPMFRRRLKIRLTPICVCARARVCWECQFCDVVIVGDMISPNFLIGEFSDTVCFVMVLVA